MLKTNLIDVIKSFSKEELRSFFDFVSSPYHNSSGSVVKLVEQVKKYYPDFENRNFTKEKLFQKIFPSGEYNDQVMRNLLSDALQLCHEFLSEQWFRNNKTEKMRYLLHQLRIRNLDSLYDKNLKAAYKEVQKEHSLDFLFFENLYRLESEVFLNELTHNRQESIYPVVVRQGELLTYDYLSKLINHIIDMQVNETYYSIKDNNSFTKELFAGLNIEPILDKLKNGSEKEYSVFLIFYYRALLALKGKEEDYLEFKKIFMGHTKLFNRQTNYNLITTLETYCINNIKFNSAKYRAELHEVHRKSIELDLLKLYKEGYLNLLKFWNIFINSVEINQVQWAEEFAEAHYSDLEPDIREGAINFARAIVAYKKQDYDKALEILNRTKLSQFLFKLSIKTFYLRIYFEKGDYQSAGFALDSYKQFLYKNKTISDAYRSNYLNFAAMYNEIMKAASGEKRSTKEELLEKIESFSSNIHSKQWLLEMIDHIE
ncbi:MAG TPA: hypothetical protein PK753_00015 [Ignavibacteria bacterium]|nr:hypothetical protein [Ignavibacteria bacterium]